jgi:hypothetical protein
MALNVSSRTELGGGFRLDKLKFMLALLPVSATSLLMITRLQESVNSARHLSHSWCLMADKPVRFFRIQITRDVE